MGSSGKLEVELEVKTSADKFWESVRDSTALFPKILPTHYKSIQVLEGDGKCVGSVKLLTYAEEIPGVKFSKERIDAVDEEGKELAFSVIDGDVSKFYKHLKAKLQVIPKGGGHEVGSLVKWSCEFEKASEDVPDPHLIQDFALHVFKALDDYLLKN
ncbi:MLP-like protein 423 [Macadamia integrifolia]|uniref:MLP-like protein 423 n=1 Tax=Macadamia integrifolia TaxID=60698 RepID=UPI001C4E748C|nr:MLP-like protein 423 [Macadamia integrifolia]